MNHQPGIGIGINVHAGISIGMVVSVEHYHTRSELTQPSLCLLLLRFYVSLFLCFSHSMSLCLSFSVGLFVAANTHLLVSRTCFQTVPMPDNRMQSTYLKCQLAWPQLASQAPSNSPA